MNLNSRTKCPYTLENLSDGGTFNDEHVIPDALGCPLSYSVRADMKTNSDFGNTVDANFVDSFYLRMLRHKYRVKSRAGMTSMKFEGKTSEGEHPVILTLPHVGPAEIYFRKPYIPREDRLGGRLIAGADVDEKATELSRSFARKGKQIEFRSVDSKPHTDIETGNDINLTHLKVGLMKIAYLAAFEYLGDTFLNDPLNCEWQKAIRATKLEEIEEVKIQGVCFDDSAILDSFIPKLESHQHAVLVMNLDQTGPMVGVRLFGSIALSLLCKVSETETHGMRDFQGKLVVCDATAKTITVSPWEDYFRKNCTVALPRSQF